MATLKEKREYIQKKLEKGSAVHIYCILTDRERDHLSKYFKISKQPFGYVRFENK